MSDQKTLDAARWLEKWMWRKTEPEDPAVAEMRCVLACIADRRGRQTGISDDLMQDVYRLSLSKERRVMEFLESLPVKRPDYVAEYRPNYYMLDTDGFWIPVTAGEVNETNGWLMASIEETDGDYAIMACRPGHWAHVDADDNPSLIVEYRGDNEEAIPHWRREESRKKSQTVR